MFPVNPDVWLKDLASYINVQLTQFDVSMSDDVFQGRSPGLYLSVCNCCCYLGPSELAICV